MIYLRREATSLSTVAIYEFSQKTSECGRCRLCAAVTRVRLTGQALTQQPTHRRTRASSETTCRAHVTRASPPCHTAVQKTKTKSETREPEREGASIPSTRTLPLMYLSHGPCPSCTSLTAMLTGMLTDRTGGCTQCEHRGRRTHAAQASHASRTPSGGPMRMCTGYLLT